ncbi:hypothetical protein [Streptomyces sp. SID13031]|uniref:hypothetical protein n=1 Tax=Streptomyces sp. SID13031 TaxID=2706046 RepID=UPI0013C655A1|nr:hypothetical protein [Streptomyces sp. SID13031]NEA32818.1 hypothetical protein [Streptomyces sp. SID13031]
MSVRWPTEAMSTGEGVLSLVDVAAGWQEEIAELQARAEAAEYGLVPELRLVVRFRGPVEIPRVRVGGLHTQDRRLSVDVTLPQGIVRDRADLLLIMLQEAVDKADEYAGELDRADDLWAVWRVLTRLCSGGTPYERWIDAYMVAHHDPQSVPTQPCPACGEHRLRLEFEVRDPCADHGTAYFWCNACLIGPMPATAPLPPHARTTPWGTLNPPNYKIVPEPADH